MTDERSGNPNQVTRAEKLARVKWIRDGLPSLNGELDRLVAELDRLRADPRFATKEAMDDIAETVYGLVAFRAETIEKLDRTSADLNASAPAITSTWPVLALLTAAGAWIIRWLPQARRDQVGSTLAGRLTQLGYMSLVTAAVAATDLLSKAWWQTYTEVGSQALRDFHFGEHMVHQVPGWFTGTGLGMVAGLFVVVFALGPERLPSLIRTGIGLFAGGVLGNALDLVHGSGAVDFLSVVPLGIANIADVFLAAGLALIGYDLGRGAPGAAVRRFRQASAGRAVLTASLYLGGLLVAGGLIWYVSADSLAGRPTHREVLAFPAFFLSWLVGDIVGARRERAPPERTRR